LSYGASPREQYQRAAYYVDRILRGAVPSDLPIERAIWSSCGSGP